MNPRRADWCSDDKCLDRQIVLELSNMDECDIIVMTILGTSKPPISLMEIGIHAKDKNLLVFCPKSFYRFSNVLHVCKRHDVKMYSLDYENDKHRNVVRGLTLRVIRHIQRKTNEVCNDK